MFENCCNFADQGGALAGKSRIKSRNVVTYPYFVETKHFTEIKEKLITRPGNKSDIFGEKLVAQE